MTIHDLGRLVVVLMGAPESDVPSSSTDDKLQFVTRFNGESSLIVVRKRARGPALGGIGLPAVANTAKNEGVSTALVVTTGVIDPERRGDLDRALRKVLAATAVRICVLDGSDLVGKVGAKPDVRKRFFPSIEEVEEVVGAEGVSRGLVKAAVAVAPASPTGSFDRRAFGAVRLMVATVVIVLVVAVPVRVSAPEACWVGGVGLGSLLAIGLLGRLSSAWFGRALERFRGPLIEQVLPLPDRTSVLRLVATAKPGVLALLAMIGLVSIVRLFRLLLVNGLLIFVALFTLVYLLLWGIDPTACAIGAPMCHGAFSGAGGHPSVGAFAYVATRSAFFNPPSDLSANSRLVQGVITGEIVCAAALLVGFAASLGLPDGLWTSRDAPLSAD